MKVKVYTNGDMVGMYLDWFNNFLTISAFARHYGISEHFAESIIEYGRELVNDQLHGGRYINVTLKG